MPAKKHFSEPELLPEVLTKEFSLLYERYRKNLPEMDEVRPKQMRVLANRMGVDEPTFRRLHARQRVEKEVGANQHFTGNGLTKLSRDGEPIRYGAGETYIFDRAPTTLGQYKNLSDGKARIAIMHLSHRKSR